MILIGSRAIKHHFEDFRDVSNSDYDIICCESDFDNLNNFFPGMRTKQFSPNRTKAKAGNIKIDFEFHKAYSNFLLLNRFEGLLKNELFSLRVADPEALLMLKASHVCFPLKSWNKTFNDYHFLKNKKVNYDLNFGLENILKYRIEETKKKYKFKDHNFNKKNEDFFNDSVKRVVPHDSLHDVLAFNKEPMFLKVKDDLSKAEISYAKFLNLEEQEKIDLILEETMVLMAERFIIPRSLNNITDDYIVVFKKIYKRMCTHYLPFDFRLYAVDKYEEIKQRLLPEQAFLNKINKVLPKKTSKNIWEQKGWY